MRQLPAKSANAPPISDRNQTLAEFITKLSKLPLAHQPGEVREYSMSTDVLGRIVEVVSGSELDRFIAERIDAPLGMTATDFFVQRGRPQSATGFGRQFLLD